MSSAALPPDLTIGIITYNGFETLPGTLAAIEGTYGRHVPVLVMDDGSDDGTPDWVEQHAPHVRLCRIEPNTARTSMLRNRILTTATTRYVLLMDDDVALTEGCVETLYDVMRSREGVLSCTPRLLDASCPERIYADGGGIHFLGVSTGSARGASAQRPPAGSPFDSVGGGIMLVDGRLAAEVGGFDEGYLFGWGDDGEFHVRGRLMGFHCLHVPEAHCLHHPEIHEARRAFGQLYNRYRFVFTVYAGRTLALLAPAMLLFELLLTAMSLTKGFSGARFRAIGHMAKTWGDVRARRRRVQATRTIRDAAILEAGPLDLPGAYVRSGFVARGARALEGAMTAYYRLVRRWL